MSAGVICMLSKNGRGKWLRSSLMFNCWLSQLKCDVGSTVTRDES
jgi:hypothetical protein